MGQMKSKVQFEIPDSPGDTMRAMIQLEPPIWVTTPLGEGHCLVLIDYGVSTNTVWLVHIFETGKVYHVDSSDIRVMGNAMYGIEHPGQPGREDEKGNRGKAGRRA